jgi:hypothetical protein
MYLISIVHGSALDTDHYLVVAEFTDRLAVSK